MVSRHKTKVLEQSPELRWLASRPPELREFEGKWVLVVGQRVLASGDSPLELSKTIPEDLRGKGLLHRVTPRDFDPTAIFIG